MQPHSAGPFRLISFSPVWADCSHIISDESGFAIARVIQNCSISPETALANAVLLNAAPELLEVLEGLHKALSRMIYKHDRDSKETEWLAHSHEAILRARGS